MTAHTRMFVPCNISTCVNYRPGVGTHCPECKLLWRAFIATDASDLFTFEQYVEMQNKEASEIAILEAEYQAHNRAEEEEWERAQASVRAAEAAWLIG